MTRSSHSVRVLLSLALLAPVAWCSAASAHLCLIRQGPESGGQPEAGNRYGYALAAGDFNGDGLEDLATGAPDDGQGDPVPGFDGALTVNYGSEHGLTHVGAQYITIGDVPDAVARFGWSLAVGNFNNDAYADLAVGAPDLDHLGVSNAGAVFIYMGNPLGLPSTASTFFDQEMIGEVSEADDKWGFALCTGDFNGDGFDDLAVGAVGEDFEKGAVAALYGSGGGLTVAGAQTFRHDLWGGLTLVGSSLGWALASGNVAGSSHDDLVIGAPYEEVLGEGIAGRVYVIHGSGSGLDDSNPIALDGSIAGSGISSPKPNEFGYALAVGEFPQGNAEYSEVIIGEPGFDHPAETSSGRVLVGTAHPDSEWVEVTASTGSGAPKAGDRFGAAVAAGRYEGGSYDDLAVSAPGADAVLVAGTFGDVGRIYLFDPGPAGVFTPLFTKKWFPIDLNDKWFEAGTGIGGCLAFGQFDASGWDNLAVGAPKKSFDVWVDDQGPNLADAGQVYVVATWRQVQGLLSRSAIAIDCEGEIVFSQRPFSPVPLASVTKTMTGLLACEAIDGGFNPFSVHAAPDWVANNIPCNCWPFVEGQQTSFIDLVRITMGKSSNDAAFSVADMLAPSAGWVDLANTVPDFVDAMNARALELGMFGTRYSNPAGHDVPHHTIGTRPYSTAWDQAILAQAAMENECLREVVGTDDWNILTLYPAGTFLNFNIDVFVNQFLRNTFKTDFDAYHSDAIGIKGGLTVKAKRTAMYAVLNTSPLGEGYVVGTGFGFETPEERYMRGKELMQLALAQCTDTDTVPQPPPPPGDDPAAVLNEISTCDSVVTGMTASAEDLAYNPLLITALPTGVSSYPADFSFYMQRQTVFELEPGAFAGLSLSRTRSGEGWRIVNVGAESADLMVITGTPFSINLDPGEEYLLPGFATIQESSTQLSIQNLSASTQHSIQLEMKMNRLPLSLVDAFDSETVSLGRAGTPIADDVQLFVYGDDSECTNSISVSFNAGNGSPVAVDPIVTPRPNEIAIGRFLGSHPNPFQLATTIRYALQRPADVHLAVLDPAGRRVRTLVERARRPAGDHAEVWDGRDRYGARVPSGVYFVYLEMDGVRDGGRIVVLR